MQKHKLNSMIFNFHTINASLPRACLIPMFQIKDGEMKYDKKYENHRLESESHNMCS